MSDARDDRRRETRSYIIGYVGALLTTAIAFAAVRWPSVGGGWTFAIVLLLALLQMVVHFRFFLHVSLARSARDDLQLVLFSALIVILMVSGTLVLLFNLHARMM